jgi:hypothetical protein
MGGTATEKMTKMRNDEADVLEIEPARAGIFDCAWRLAMGDLCLRAVT